MKILLLGKNGQVGWELQRTLAPLGEIIALGRRELDLADQQAIRNTVRRIKPELIVNAAAYTAVDKAKEEPELAMAINGIAPGILAEEAALIKAPIVHYSTDYVFDGTKNESYTEQDTPNPINVYGRTKLAGEKAIMETECRCLILRTSWVYSLRGSNFLLTMQRLFKERDELQVVSDQFGSPTWARMIAEATAQALAFDRANRTLHGVFHLSATGQTSWHGFAEAILKIAPPVGSAPPRLKAINTTEYKTAAARPKSSVMNCSIFEAATGLKIPEWQDLLVLALQ